MRYLLPITNKPMPENLTNNDRSSSFEGSGSSHSDLEFCTKRYAQKRIEKRIVLLITIAALTAIASSFLFISKQNLYVFRDVWNVDGLKKNVKTVEFGSYKTPHSSIAFELLSQKFKKHKGIYGIQYSPSKQNLAVYIKDSSTSKEMISRILYTKTKQSLGYPASTKEDLYKYQLTIENYYDSFDGLILKNKLKNVEGIYFIESDFKAALYVNIFGKKGVNPDTIKTIIEKPYVVMPLKDIPTKVETSYIVSQINVEEANNQRSRVYKKILVLNNYESDDLKLKDMDTDTLRLAMLKFPYGRKLTYRSFLDDIDIKGYHIKSIVARSTESPELEIVFKRSTPQSKNKLYLLLKRPYFTHITSKGKKKQVENPYSFYKKN